MEADTGEGAPWYRRLPIAIGCVLLVYGVCIALNDPGGSLGTDTGAKVATLDRMVEDGTAEPDVGYWAERWDADGDYHPLFDTKPQEDGGWVNVTTLPMLQAARPLYALGGYRLTLLLPVLGAVLAAVAARDIARRLSSDEVRAENGMRAFWVVALGSPIAIYALDFWEHSLGAGLMTLGVAAMLRVVDASAPAPAAGAVAGIAFGAAATMRSEALVVGFVAVGAACLWRVVRDVVPAVLAGVGAVAGFAVPWFANAVLEDRVGGNSRATRAGRDVSRDFWNAIGERVEEAFITWFGMPFGTWQQGVFFGLVLSVVVGVFVRRADSLDERAVRLVGAVGAVVYLLVLVNGLGFVPGALVASPVAAAAVGIRRLDRNTAYVVAVAVLGTPLIWAFQFTGGAQPQWGGRYLLATTVLLTVLGAVALASTPRAVQVVVIGFAGVVTALGFTWLFVRSHDIADTFDRLEAYDDDVLISTNGFFLREGGAAVMDETWLSIGRRGDLDGAVSVAERSGASTIGVLTATVEPPDIDATHRSTDTIELLNIELRYHRYELGG